MSNSHIGTDESGKGDYFGPLVVAGVVVDEATQPRLGELGVRDSKTLSNRRVVTLADKIISLCPHALVTIGPPRYNELYAKIGNLNHLLAWAHARAIEDLLEKVPGCPVVVDKFADQRVLQSALMQRGKATTVTQRVRAEDDMAVAAASIVARARFLGSLDELSEAWSLRLAAGAGPPVLEAGRTFIATHGKQALAEVAKLHFKTTATLGAR